ncbi:hypothetical protein SAMN04487928_10251 [Butyrivibrio proteoclasticus]|uniref:Uncharacterized protein n=1 Tax=Butyrivibrio proteoclasticus TaxID=43305 RepID=A0A1I5QCW5_9FIRM|nr:hypothetical protein [Butyrivibrio proteoclasticus]SFP43891.1 hypothetical protein SAMN04487928_10251 [Butyrivibrio proteoclasticus]
MASNEENKGKCIIGGYEFLTEKDAEKGSLDLSKIKVLETRVKVSKAEDMLTLYEKAIQSRIFKTPLGWRYLTDLREKLLSSGYKEKDLIPIPLEIPMTRQSSLEKLTPEKDRPTQKKVQFRGILSIVLNVVLIIVVILMFVIASTSENDNIINYKRNITNRYSAWDEELKEREKAVREAEKRLGITDSKGYDEGDESY